MSVERRGLLIVFEGLDRSGKTTQTRLLKKYFDPEHAHDHMHKAHLVRFPERNSETGKKIDAYLSKLVSYDNEEIHELFSQNRWELKDHLLGLIEKGVSIIIDRYAYSGAAYSTAKGLDLDWCKRHDIGLPKPDLIFYIDASEDLVATRAGFGEEAYESKEFQRKVRETYEKLIDDQWHRIQADLTPEKIHSKVISHVEEHLKKFTDQSSSQIEALKQLWL